MSDSTILLRPLNFCYKGFWVNGRTCWDKKAKESHLMVCGCANCDPIGFADWERKYASAK